MPTSPSDTAVQMECAVLGSVLYENKLWPHAGELTITDFSTDAHRTIFARMAAMFEDGRPVDLLTITEELVQKGELDRCGGHAYLASLDDHALPENIGTYVKSVRKASCLKQAQRQVELMAKTNDLSLLKEQTQSLGKLLADDSFYGGSKNAAPSESLLLAPGQLKERETKSGAFEQLVEGLLPRRGPNVAVGDSNIGKSPLVVQLAVCVAAGLPFLGCETKQGKVVLVDYENTGLLSNMIEQTSKAVGADSAVVEQNLSIVDPDQVPSLDELITLTKDAVLVVVDSLRFLTHGDDSNGKVTMPILQKLSLQKNCWLLVHHIRKGEAKAEDQIDPLVKADSVIHWLECASGHRSIINQTTNRWAIDNRSIRTDLLLRVAAKGRAESAPLYLSRIFEGEEPIGYARAKGLDFLTEGQQQHFKSLVGMTLSFDEMAKILKNNSTASRLLKACRANGLVNPVDGNKYRFVAQ